MSHVSNELFAECQRLYQHNQELYNTFFQTVLRYRRLNSLHAAHYQQQLARYEAQRQHLETQLARTRLTYMVG
jgi:uncharacterized membrane protein